jgi:hypothetical protein
MGLAGLIGQVQGFGQSARQLSPTQLPLGYLHYQIVGLIRGQADPSSLQQAASPF